MDIMHHPSQNHLLAALPPADLKRIASHLELVAMPLGDVLYESSGPLQHVYFPTTAIVSIHNVMENGASSEIAGVGNEGVPGVSLFMGGNTTPSRAVVHAGGYGYRLKERLLMDEFNRGGAMQHLLLRYTQALMIQVSQAAVCNRHHSIEQQLCRWLLLILDRLPSNDLTLTQELIAGMLGVRRESVTVAAGHLQQVGCIRYRRGRISVLDRLQLESRVCECYTVVKNELYRLFPEAQDHQAILGQRRRENSRRLLECSQPAVATFHHRNHA